MGKLPKSVTELDFETGIDMRQSARRPHRPVPEKPLELLPRAVSTGKGIKFSSPRLSLPAPKSVAAVPGNTTSAAAAGNAPEKAFLPQRATVKTSTPAFTGGGRARRAYLNVSFPKPAPGTGNGSVLDAITEGNVRRVAYISRDEAAIEYAPEELDTENPVFTPYGMMSREAATERLGTAPIMSVILSPEDNVYDLPTLGDRFIRDSLLWALSAEPAFYCYCCHYNTGHPHIHVIVSLEKKEGGRDDDPAHRRISVNPGYYKGRRARRELEHIMMRMAGEKSDVELIRQASALVSRRRIGLLDSLLLENSVYDELSGRHYLKPFREETDEALLENRQDRLKELRSMGLAERQEVSAPLSEQTGTKKPWSFTRRFADEVTRYRYRILTGLTAEEASRIEPDSGPLEPESEGIIEKVDFDAAGGFAYILMCNEYGIRRLYSEKAGKPLRIEPGVMMTKQAVLDALGKGRTRE